MMSYTKPSQVLFAANLSADEFVVQLDTLQYVAVSAIASVEGNTGNTAIVARARVVLADGKPFVDAVGERAETAYPRSADTANLALIGGIEQFKKLMLLTVLGENPAWPHTLDQTVQDHVSIRTNIASAAHAGPVTNAATLL
jgi:hypothetical protein